MSADYSMDPNDKSQTKEPIHYLDGAISPWILSIIFRQSSHSITVQKKEQQKPGYLYLIARYPLLHIDEHIKKRMND